MKRKEIADKIQDIDLNNCTERQKMVINMLEQGMKYSEIAERIGCSRQNVYQIVESAKKPKHPMQKHKNPQADNTNKKKRESIDYSLYFGKDLSGLTYLERKIMQLKLSGMANKDIASLLEITPVNVGTKLNHARKKLDGERAYPRKYYLSSPEKLDEVQKERPGYIENFYTKVPRTDYSIYRGRNMECLSKREEDVMLLAVSGMRNYEIALRLGLSQSVVGSLLRRAGEKLEGELVTRKYKKRENGLIGEKNPIMDLPSDYSVYRGRNMECLSKREEEALTLRISGMHNDEIAVRLGLSKAYVAAILRRAVGKLDGKIVKRKYKKRGESSG